METETTRVEVIRAHYYDGDRKPGERYDCANRFLLLVVERGYVRIVDQQQQAVHEVVITSTTNPETIEIPLKRKRGRPFGSGMGHYKKRSIVSETSVDHR
jgi:hypothetical protein